MDFTQRINQLELMDTVSYPSSVMKQTLNFLSLTNHYFGGSQVVLKYLDQWSKIWPHDKTIRILDVGTGAGDIPKTIAKWAQKKNLSVHITAIDLVKEVVEIAQKNTRGIPEITIKQENIFSLAEQNEKFDYVIASLLLHHTLPNETNRLMKIFDQMASRGIIISDLLRSKKSYWAVKLLSLLLGNAIVRHDGPLSVRRAFTAQELNQLAKQNDLSYLYTRNEPWFRLSLAGEKIEG